MWLFYNDLSCLFNIYSKRPYDVKLDALLDEGFLLPRERKREWIWVYVVGKLRSMVIVKIEMIRNHSSNNMLLQEEIGSELVHSNSWGSSIVKFCFTASILSNLHMTSLIYVYQEKSNKITLQHHS